MVKSHIFYDGEPAPASLWNTAIVPEIPPNAPPDRLLYSEDRVPVTDGTNFASLGSGGIYIILTRQGCVVTCVGGVVVKTAGYIQGGNSATFAQIPEQYRPQQIVNVVAHPENYERCMFQATPAGQMNLTRHTGTQPANTWVLFNATWSVAK